MSLKRTPLSSVSENVIKKSRSDDVDLLFGDLSKTKPQPKNYPPNLPPLKNDSSSEDGKPSLLWTLREGITYSQHYVEPQAYYNFGVALNEGSMWQEVLRAKTEPRVTTGHSRSRFMSFVENKFEPIDRIFKATKLCGKIVNTWGTKYDDLIGSMGGHFDMFSYTQTRRSVFTLGTSKKHKFIRFEECIENGRWVEFWLPHASLLSMDAFASGAARPRNENKNITSTSPTTDKDGKVFVSHAISQAQGTMSCFLEFRPEPGYTSDQVLADLHSALAASPIIHCNEHPPFPKPSQIGEEICLKMTRQEASKLAHLTRHGQYPLESAHDVQVEFKEDGLIADTHRDAPSCMNSSHVYCTLCDCLVNWNDRGAVRRHIATPQHQHNKKYGGWERGDIETLLECKQKAINNYHGIEMGDDPLKFYCTVCNQSLSCKRFKKLKGCVNGYKTSFHNTKILNHVKSCHETH